MNDMESTTGVIKCSYMGLEKITAIVRHPMNPNEHPKKQIALLADIMKYQGIRQAAVISTRSALLTKGHARLEAALLNGWTEYPCDFQDYESEEQELADLVADNKIAELAESSDSKIQAIALTMPHFDFKLFGMPNFRLEDLTTSKGEDEIPSIPKICRSKIGDLFILGNHRLLCGDSTDIVQVEKLMDGDKADMVFTDPPYNINYIPEDRAKGGRSQSNALGGIENDSMTSEKFEQFLTDSFSALDLVLKEGGGIYLCSPIGFELKEYLDAWEKFEWKYQAGLVWVKNNHSISRFDYHPKHEIIHYGWKLGSGHQWFGDRNKFTTWDISRDSGTEYKHPTQKPVIVSETAVNNSSKQGQIVLDVFGGSGATLIACEKTNRKCFMMELDPHYCDVILERWSIFTSKDPVREDGIKWSELKNSSVEANTKPLLSRVMDKVKGL